MSPGEFAVLIGVVILLTVGASIGVFSLLLWIASWWTVKKEEEVPMSLTKTVLMPDLDPATARAALEEMRRSHAKLAEENAALRVYVDFLGKAYHGCHASEANIEEGRRLRVLAGLPEWSDNDEVKGDDDIPWQTDPRVMDRW